ncbi:MAG: Asp-tRNA(Asn)/Glu-tRNA(Gln) amidotransferase subunit GatC [Armatimonadetes bacterium]|nr:Asp-tRNA(Asn)/Glu-tRNA(Gln) amidotransferase subunit GatC [Armatimonadota bacterium]
MAISFDEVQHVARLARLELSNSELLIFQSELNALLGHFSDLNEIDVTGILPKPHAVSMHNVWADDIAEVGLTREYALRNAPRSRAGLFVVPTIIEE